MSSYTTELRFICEQYSNLEQSRSGNVDKIIETAIPHIFDFDFPIFDISYKDILCKKILKHYYTREIGFETVGLWKLKLNTKLNEIMPYYNLLYNERKAVIDKDLLSDIVTTRESRGTDNREYRRDTQSNSENVTRDMYSDTPQGALDNVENETYLTNASKTTNSQNNTGSENGVDKNNDMRNETVRTNFNGLTYLDIYERYVKAFKDIDLMIINDLNDLFFMLW
nr:MAG TPA: Lower collar protein [Caudoviricetes sp.]